MFKFITKRPLWQNILFAVVLVIIILFLFLQSLNLLTRHGDTLVIPSVTGKSFEEAKKILESQGFDVQIQDSVYNDTAKALAVLRQFPEGEDIVKVNRTVYLTINRAAFAVQKLPSNNTTSNYRILLTNPILPKMPCWSNITKASALSPALAWPWEAAFP